MKPGDIVRRNNKKNHLSAKARAYFKDNELGLFIGLKTSKAGYTYSEVMWFDERSPNGDVVSTVQSSLIEVVKDDA